MIRKSFLSFVFPSPLIVEASSEKGQPDAQTSWTKCARVVAGSRFLGLADQTIVSGTSFLSTVLIARAGDPSELGIYAVSISILTILLSVQETLVLTPYSVQLHNPLATHEEHAGSSLALSTMLSASGLLIFLVAAAILGVSTIATPVVAMTGTIGLVIPFVLLREFGRRFAFANLRIHQALIQDVIASALQIGALAWLYGNGLLTAVNATLALGAACLLTSLGWFLIMLRQLSFRREELRENFERSWCLGKWLLGGRLSVNVQGYGSYWILTLLFGAAATGVYAACMNIVSFANPLIYGLTNVITPRLALAFKEGGGCAVWQLAIKEALLLGVVVSAFCFVVALGGDHLMQLLYRGPEFSGYWHALVILSLAILALAVSMPAASALATIERPRAILATAAFASVVTLVLVAVLAVNWGVTGAAYGYLVGNAILAVGRWTALFRIVEASACEPTVALLAELIQSDPGQNFSITRLGEGDHATGFLVTAQGRGRLLQGCDRLVIKLFKPAAGIDIAAAEKQFEALARLHLALDGLVTKGWTFSVPAPIRFSRSPLAIIMSAIDGQDIDRCRLPPEKLEHVAQAFVAAMQQCWTRGHAHGDLGFQNVFFDFDVNKIALIDPGTLESCRSCHRMARSRHAAALDLGHLIADLARGLVHRSGKRGERLRRQYFIERVTVAAAGEICSREGRSEFLREIECNVVDHIEDFAAQASGFKRQWHRIVLPIKLRCARDVLKKIGKEVGVLGLPAGNIAVSATDIAT